MIYNLPRKGLVLPKKGDLIGLDLDGNGSKQYRVLSMDGSVAKIMAMYDDLISAWDENYPTVEIGDIEVAKYESSEIDTYLNTTWYKALKDSVKIAIVSESVVCDVWCDDDSGDPVYTGTYGSSVAGTLNYTISKYAGGALNIGSRNVFALSVQDVIDYLNDSSVQVDTTAILRNVNIWKMFWNDETSHYGKYLWLQSAYIGDSGYAWGVTGLDGGLGTEVMDISYIVRPVLNLNLSQVPFTK